MNVHTTSPKRVVLNIHLPNENCAYGYCRMYWHSAKYTSNDDDYSGYSERTATNSDDDSLRLQSNRVFSPKLELSLYSHVSRRKRANLTTCKYKWKFNQSRVKSTSPRKHVYECFVHPLNKGIDKKQQQQQQQQQQKQQTCLPICTGGFWRPSDMKVLTPGEVEFGVSIENPKKLHWWSFRK